MGPNEVLLTCITSFFSQLYQTIALTLFSHNWLWLNKLKRQVALCFKVQSLGAAPVRWAHFTKLASKLENEPCETVNLLQLQSTAAVLHVSGHFVFHNSNYTHLIWRQQNEPRFQVHVLGLPHAHRSYTTTVLRIYFFINMCRVSSLPDICPPSPFSRAPVHTCPCSGREFTPTKHNPTFSTPVYFHSLAENNTTLNKKRWYFLFVKKLIEQNLIPLIKKTFPIWF